MSLGLPDDPGLSNSKLDAAALLASSARPVERMSERQRKAQVAALTANRGEIEAEKLARVLGAVTDRQH
jgi:hypothetical protein